MREQQQQQQKVIGPKEKHACAKKMALIHAGCDMKTTGERERLMKNSPVQKRCEVRRKMEQKKKKRKDGDKSADGGVSSRDTEYLEESGRGCVCVCGGESCLHNGN